MEHPGGCRRTENQCAFAHYNTGLLAAKSGGMAMEIDPSLQPKSEQTTSTRNIFTFDKKSQTCFFWAQGTCKKPAEKCKYAHYHTGAAPQPPPNWKDQFGGTPLGFDTPTSMETPAAEDWPALVSAPPTYACAEMKKMIEDTCKLDFVKMFTFNETSRGLMDRRAFLIYHPDDHAEELELVTRWLLMSHVEIFNFWMPGSWDAFKDAIFRGGSGVIIVHDLILAPLKDIPDFGKLLRGNDIRVWCVGHQDPDYYIPLVSPAWIPQEYNCIEVFPMGGVIVMTDDVFEKNPVEALNIVTKFIEKVDETQKFDMPFECGRSLLDRYVAWRLIVRPGIMQWLYDWCIAHEKQCEAKEPHAQA
jgi:chromo domain-containing protein 1